MVLCGAEFLLLFTEFYRLSGAKIQEKRVMLTTYPAFTLVCYVRVFLIKICTSGFALVNAALLRRSACDNPVKQLLSASGLLPPFAPLNRYRIKLN